MFYLGEDVSKRKGRLLTASIGVFGIHAVQKYLIQPQPVGA